MYESHRKNVLGAPRKPMTRPGCFDSEKERDDLLDALEEMLSAPGPDNCIPFRHQDLAKTSTWARRGVVHAHLRNKTTGEWVALGKVDVRVLDDHTMDVSTPPLTITKGFSTDRVRLYDRNGVLIIEAEVAHSPHVTRRCRIHLGISFWSSLSKKSFVNLRKGHVEMLIICSVEERDENGKPFDYSIDMQAHDNRIGSQWNLHYNQNHVRGGSAHAVTKLTDQISGAARQVSATGNRFHVASKKSPGKWGTLPAHSLSKWRPPMIPSGPM